MVNSNEKRNKKRRLAASFRSRHSWLLMFYDTLVLLAVCFVMLLLAPSASERLGMTEIAVQTAMVWGSLLLCRMLGSIYQYIWRYGGTTLYVRLILTDVAGGALYYLVQRFLAPRSIMFLRALSLVAVDLLLIIAMRLIYQYLYEYSSQQSGTANFLRRLTARVTGLKIEPVNAEGVNSAGMNGGRRIKVAIVGAGRVGVSLGEDLINNPSAAYYPSCYIDIDEEKIGRNINGVEVLAEKAVTADVLARYGVQEIIFALPEVDMESKRAIYEHYKAMGLKIKVYDYPSARTVEKGKRHLREFDIEELLFRQEKRFVDERTMAYYSGKTVLISGGGGSIGSELARQIAKMGPGQLIILDVYENCAYDIQQELRIAYGGALDLQVEIVNMTDAEQLEKVFDHYRPDIVLHAAAHKHVPLMEHNCVEAVKNNVFGTLNMVNMSEKYGVKKFIMISTDKAVNPTNVMGATKRMCEMIVQSRADGKTNFSATRFGNVLGSNGSVIPLFKRQIMNGGPVTLTDKRIIRYFMTIPEASQLVLTSGAMAKNGELFVLDMGKPVKILELAENMIRLSGFEPYKDIDIIETGLRPGEKLYEELLIKTEELRKTDNKMIFVEKDAPLSRAEIDAKLEVLRRAVDTEDNDTCRQALKQVVPTFHSAKHVNQKAEQAEEMRQVHKYDGTQIAG